MSLGPRRLRAGEPLEDRVLAGDDGAVVEHEHGDRVDADRRQERRARLPLDGDLADDVVDPELGQALSDAPRGGAPLGLP